MGKLGLTKKGKISISIEKPPSAAGEVVHGIIQASVSEPIRCEAVVLKATGKEKMSWDQLTGEDLRAESFQRKYDYFDEKIVISEVHQTLQPGEYSYPFQFKPPPRSSDRFSLDSFNWFEVSNLDVCIEYKFKATLEVDGFLSQNLRAKADLVFHDNLLQTFYLHQHSPKRINEDYTFSPLRRVAILGWWAGRLLKHHTKTEG